MDPMTMLQGAQAAGGMVEVPFKIYGGLQQLKMDRAQLREQKKQNRASRLRQLMLDAGNMRDDASAMGRMQALRAGGGML